MNEITVVPGDKSELRLAQRRGPFRDRFEHGLHVRRRAADDLENLRRRGLPLPCLLGLVEQAHVLDGNHGLIGEGLQKRDLLVREWSRFSAADTDYADRISLAHQGNGQGAAEPSRSSSGTNDIIRVLENVGDRDNAPSQNRSGRRRVAAGRPRKSVPPRIGTGGIQIGDGSQVDELAVERENEP